MEKMKRALSTRFKQQIYFIYIRFLSLGDQDVSRELKRIMLNNDPAIDVFTKIHLLSKMHPKLSKKMLKMYFRTADLSQNYENIVNARDLILEIDQSRPTFNIILVALRRRGCLSKSLEIIGKAPDSYRFATYKAQVLSEVEILRKGVAINLRKNNSFSDFRPQNKKLLYLLHNALPYQTGGYAMRSHGLLKAMHDLGWSVTAVTRLGYPIDQNMNSEYSVYAIDGVKYRYLPDHQKNRKTLPLGVYLDSYIEAVSKIVEEERPSIIHGASFFYNGIVASVLGKRFSIPSCYEIRGLLEITTVSRRPAWQGSEECQLLQNLEAEALSSVAGRFVITSGLKELMSQRITKGNNIKVLPNGVDSKRFKHSKVNIHLKKRLGLRGTVIGYLGSVLDYEGIDDLVRAIKQMDDRGLSGFSVLIVGDGAALEDIKNLVNDQHLTDLFFFAGRVPPFDVENYLAVADICVYPRKPWPVCELVSPLKPLEAMAMGKAVVASNVAALSEMVHDRETGLLFSKGNSESLAEALESLLIDPILRDRLGGNAREWVTESRDWSIIGANLSRYYDVLLR
jgi:glycosyltransferase involved in cell wall biosynthesis